MTEDPFYDGRMCDDGSACQAPNCPCAERLQHRELTDLRCSVCGSLEIAIADGAGTAHCLTHLPDQWRPLFEPPIFDPEALS